MPEFTPLQLKLRIRYHNDLGVQLVSKQPVDAIRPPGVPLQDRIPRNGTMATTSSCSSGPSNTAATAAAAAPPVALPPISSLPTASIKAQLQALDLLFEPSTELHTLALPALKRKAGPSADQPPPPGAPAADSAASSSSAFFDSYAELIQHIGMLLASLAAQSAASAAARQKLHGILGSHPRLGARKVESAQSQAEQANLNRGGGVGEDEAARLRALNAEYEARFPGLRFVVFVNGRGRPEVMDDMRRRIDRGDFDEEEREAIRAMVDIALDRAGKLEAAREAASS
jgi:2-oxo-4-hydroxy-4-carboxy--5-ureidoimidazoline (OHCU) decarboxylase